MSRKLTNNHRPTWECATPTVSNTVTNKLNWSDVSQESARARDVLVPLRTERVLCSYCPPSGLAACASAQTLVLCIRVHSCILRLFCQLALLVDTFSSYSLHFQILGCACTCTVGILENTHEMRNYKPKSYIGSAYAESDGAFQSRLA